MAKKIIPGQIDFDTFLGLNRSIFPSCSKCVCRSCLMWWSERCPYGGCYDDLRAKENPYNKVHPDQSPRTAWSNWNKPGEQAHWCRGGVIYPQKHCDKFVKYHGCKIKECIKAPVTVYQDGYISCSLVESVGCDVCYQEFLQSEVN